MEFSYFDGFCIKMRIDYEESIGSNWYSSFGLCKVEGLY